MEIRHSEVSLSFVLNQSTCLLVASQTWMQTGELYFRHGTFVEVKILR